MTALIGVLGTGSLAEFLIRGAEGAPYRFLLSPRSGERARRLAKTHEAEIAQSNQAVVDAADRILVCLPAAEGPEILKGLRFPPGQSVLSCMAGTGPTALAALVAPAQAAAAMMPGFANAFRAGPSVLCPADAGWQAFLGHLGPVLPFADEAQFTAAAVMGALSGAQVHWMRRLTLWFQAQGLPPDTARNLVASLMRGNAEVLLQAPESLEAIAAGVTTPGGITEALVAGLDEAGALDAWTGGLDAIRDRLSGEAP